MKTAEDMIREKGGKLISIPLDASIHEALALMAENNVTSVLVSKDGVIEGIWTQRDLARNMLEEGFDPQKSRVGDHVARIPPVSPHTASIEALLKTFARSDSRYQLIEKDGRHIGLVSESDIIWHLFPKKARDYASLFEHVGCGVYISSKEGKFIDANKAMLDMLGYDSKEEFLEIDIARELYVNPGDRLFFQKIIERDGIVIDHEVEFKRRDGRPISVLHTGHVRYGQNGKILGYEGINVDQTQRKEMEKELREAHDFLNKIVQNSPNAIMAADMKGNIIIWNSAAEEMLDYRAKDVIGKLNIRKVYPEGIAVKIMRRLRAESDGGAGILKSYPLIAVRKDGGVVEGNLSAALICDEKGAEIASVGVVVDLKERLEMERRLRDTQKQLLQSEKLAAMGRLTSQVAHELNNPLYGIMNTLELLKTEISLENKRRKILEMALSEIMRLSEMIRKMLTFSRPDQELKEEIDINQGLDEIVILHEKQLRENNIAVSCDFDKGLPRVHASKNQLRQVFLNLISNARDAMPQGGTLSISTFSDKEAARVRFKDTGLGIPPQNIAKVFDTFFTTKDSLKGVGLGLSVCYGFMKDHGGDILVESEPGAGAAFTLVLPLPKKTP
ncbi:PAS domain-containing sensor histidine kinase [Candidatus Desulfarcum epimagneticum]|uniref:histidine kinase n=1 Tax=uncultured Desulfobacteraceae bacterium TaxID=218296 RepID=A0A484HIC9_9BACT|nr:PAS domain-containing sensor histidine kinase [uncultured Desulfobacteraceae bacterium]